MSPGMIGADVRPDLATGVHHFLPALSAIAIGNAPGDAAGRFLPSEDCQANRKT
jgi:hypothetical protein